MASFSFLFSFLVISLTTTSVTSKQWLRNTIDPEVYMNVTQLITSKGYPCQEHSVQTADGFILGVQRIPHGKTNTGISSRPVVLLQHGLLSCSSCWVENLVDQSLGFILADAGMDVWLGNNRGNTYSRRHIKYKPTDEEFWAFSFDEMIKYDLPAMINYITNVTNSSQIYYVGHSQGTMQAFGAFSQDQLLGKKVKLFFALAPVVTVKYIESPIRFFAEIAGNIQQIFDLFGKYDFMPTSEFVKYLGRRFCNPELGDIACENLLFLIGGFDINQMNRTRIPVYVAENPAGTSVQNIVHFAQEIESGLFQMFDYGSENMKHYNQSIPPLYHVDQMRTPVALFTGTNDFLADPIDVENLMGKLTNSIVYHKDIDGWEHLDFIWAMDAAKECYKEIVDQIRKYESIG